MNENINILLKNPEKLLLKSMKIQKSFLTFQIKCRMSIKIWKGTTQIEDIKY